VYYDDPDERQAIRRVPAHPFVERWDIASGKMVDRFKPARGHPQLLAGGKGLWAYTADADIRDALTGRLVAILKLPEPEPAGGFQPRAATVSADGASIAVAEFSLFPDAENRILVFDLKTGELTRILRPDVPVHGLRFLPDGRLISIADAATVWDAAPKKP
jgi:hypothetical protein